jgi:4-amino-4-deoxy-L-arabinose transferase-like glycosyltransferase
MANVDLSGRRWAVGYGPEAVLLLMALALLLCGLGQRNLRGSEGRWAEISREMLLTGDYFHPTLAGKAYFDKPLMTYWAIVGVSRVTGRLDEFVVRAPSALAGVLALGATMALGRRLWSPAVGRLAGGLMLASYGLLIYSREASADAENMAAITMAVAWYFVRRDKAGFFDFLVFYLILFLGAQMKGLGAVVVPVLAIGPDVLRAGRWRMFLRPGHIAALGLGVLVYFLPFLYASLNQPSGYSTSGLALVFHENILRYIRPFDHMDPIYTYLWAVPVLLAPWIPLLIGAMVTTGRQWKQGPSDRWLLQAMLLIFLFFTFSGSRRSYYILPILPLCILWLASFLGRLHQEGFALHVRRAIDLQRTVFLIIAIAETVVVPAGLWYIRSVKDLWLPAGLEVSFAAVGGMSLLVAGIGPRLTERFRLAQGPDGAIWNLILVALLLQGGFVVWQWGVLASSRAETEFASRIKILADEMPPGRVAFYPRSNDHLLFYTRWDPATPVLNQEEDLSRFLSAGPSALIVSEMRYFPASEAQRLGLREVAAERTFWYIPADHATNRPVAYRLEKNEKGVRNLF